MSGPGIERRQLSPKLWRAHWLTAKACLSGCSVRESRVKMQYVSFSNIFLMPLGLPPKPSASAWLAFCFGRAHAAGAFMRGIGLG